MNGLDFLQAVKRFQEALPVIVMTAFGTVETAVEAMKARASDYVLKPFSLDEMRMVVHKELDVQRLRVENRSLREALQQRYQHPNLVARSAKMQEVLATVERVAPRTNSAPSCWAEKAEWVKTWWRAPSMRVAESVRLFLKINSAAIPENLLRASCLDMRKVPLPARPEQAGKFELADKGTLFLDEIGDVPPRSR